MRPSISKAIFPSVCFGFGACGGFRPAVLPGAPRGLGDGDGGSAGGDGQVDDGIVLCRLQAAELLALEQHLPALADVLLAQTQRPFGGVALGLKADDQARCFRLLGKIAPLALRPDADTMNTWFIVPATSPSSGRGMVFTTRPSVRSSTSTWPGLPAVRRSR